MNGEVILFKDTAIATLLPIMIQVATLIVGLYYFQRRFPSEQRTADAEAGIGNASANSELAKASGVWLESHNRMFAIMQERDGEIIKLNRKVLDLESNQLKHAKDVSEERAMRMVAEMHQEATETENKSLRVAVEKLNVEVAVLKDEIKKLKTKDEFQNGISIATPLG